MELKEQVVNFELSKKLYELGVKEPSIFFWASVRHTVNGASVSMENAKYTINWGGGVNIGYRMHGRGVWSDSIPEYSAFTVAELGEMLPDGTASFQYRDDEEDSWTCVKYVEHEHSKYEKIVIAKTEADARAKMLIYLIENKLLNKS